MDRTWQAQIKPTVAMLLTQGGRVSLYILLEPFYYGEDLINTRIRLDGIEVPSPYVRDLVGNTYSFPRNPVEGYIDGSVYVDETHHTVDVTELSFHRARDGTATVVVKGYFCGDSPGQREKKFVLNAQVGTFMV